MIRRYSAASENSSGHVLLWADLAKCARGLGSNLLICISTSSQQHDYVLSETEEDCAFVRGCISRWYFSDNFLLLCFVGIFCSFHKKTRGIDVFFLLHFIMC